MEIAIDGPTDLLRIRLPQASRIRCGRNTGSIGIVWKARVMVGGIFPASLRIAYRLLVAHPRAWVAHIAHTAGDGAADTG